MLPTRALTKTYDDLSRARADAAAALAHATQALRSFLHQTPFHSQGAVMTDLDGTLIHEGLPAHAALALRHAKRRGQGAGRAGHGTASGRGPRTSIGAGDAEPDNFLREVGFAAIVGNSDLDYRGKHHTVRLSNASALGELLIAASDAA